MKPEPMPGDETCEATPHTRAKTPCTAKCASCKKAFPQEVIYQMLSAAGLRLTEQRKEIVRHLYVGGHRHVNAAGLHAEICAESGEISLATIYNALNDFERAGILRRIAVPCDKVWFDTDTGHHRHFYIEAEDRVIDIDEVANLSEGPEGYRVIRTDTVVHLERDRVGAG